ncbi:hypothetical protein CLOP_g1593 [Closterium sp. NIES-67]|nr:hypothetical protein CLOP_g1593 [Closterium sp. NIES-67]
MIVVEIQLLLQLLILLLLLLLLLPLLIPPLELEDAAAAASAVLHHWELSVKFLLFVGSWDDALAIFSRRFHPTQSSSSSSSSSTTTTTTTITTTITTTTTSSSSTTISGSSSSSSSSSSGSEAAPDWLLGHSSISSSRKKQQQQQETQQQQQQAQEHQHQEQHFMENVPCSPGTGTGGGRMMLQPWCSCPSMPTPRWYIMPKDEWLSPVLVPDETPPCLLPPDTTSPGTHLDAACASADLDATFPEAHQEATCSGADDLGACFQSCPDGIATPLTGNLLLQVILQVLRRGSVEESSQEAPFLGC